MDDESQLVTRAERIEADARASLTLAAPPAVAARLGLKLLVDGGAVMSIAPAFDLLPLNRVVGLGVHERASEAQVERILALARDVGVRRLFVQLAPVAGAEQVAAWLEARGARAHDRWARLWRRTDVALPSGVASDLALTSVGVAQADAFARVVRTVFAMPPEVAPWLASVVGRPGWHHYAAVDGGEMVATGALYAAGRTAWLGYGTTLPTHRGRGAQSALIAFRIRQAAALGCDWVVTETGEDLPDHPVPSYRNMRRLGFTDAYHRQNYVVDLTSSAAAAAGRDMS